MESDKLVPRGTGRLPVPRTAALPDTPGSAEWTARAAFGGAEAFRAMLGQMVAAGGAEVDPKWRRLVSLDLRLRAGGLELNLNELCATAGVDDAELLAFVGAGVRSLNKTIATIKAATMAPAVIGLALEAAADTEKGLGDRKMLLEIAGVIEKGPGLTINNNNQAVANAHNMHREELRAPLRRFRAVQEDIDAAARDAEVIDGEVVDG